MHRFCQNSLVKINHGFEIRTSTLSIRKFTSKHLHGYCTGLNNKPQENIKKMPEMASFNHGFKSTYYAYYVGCRISRIIQCISIVLHPFDEKKLNKDINKP